MPRAFFCLFFCTCTFFSFGQAEDEYIKFFGTILNAKDSTAITASVFYEKLPYYDDMGSGTSSTEGIYEFYLLKGQRYNFRILQDGFDPFEEEVTIADAGSGAMEQIFYVQPDRELELMTLENLIFSRGSDQITESSFAGLDELVAWLDGRPSIVIQLEGHTDFAGNADANMRLSQARVESVKEYLLKKGIKKDRVLTKAFGGTQPLFTERTDEAKTKNRRVEVRIIRK